MKQTKTLIMLLVCLVAGIGFTAVSAQSANNQGSSGQSSGDAAKQQLYLTKKEASAKPLTAAEYEQKKLNGRTMATGRVVPSSHNPQVNAAPVIKSTGDRKQLLLQLKAAAVAKGLPTAKYDLELQTLNH